VPVAQNFSNPGTIYTENIRSGEPMGRKDKMFLLQAYILE